MFEPEFGCALVAMKKRSGEVIARHCDAGVVESDLGRYLVRKCSTVGRLRGFLSGRTGKEYGGDVGSMGVSCADFDELIEMAKRGMYWRGLRGGASAYVYLYSEAEGKWTFRIRVMEFEGWKDLRLVLGLGDPVLWGDYEGEGGKRVSVEIRDGYTGAFYQHRKLCWYEKGEALPIDKRELSGPNLEWCLGRGMLAFWRKDFQIRGSLYE